MVSQTAIGYISAVIAVVFFGSNYVPAKKYPTGNGLVFQWMMCNGILLVGFIGMAASSAWPSGQPWTVHWEGLIGGGVWAMGNLMVIPIFNTIGLGLGFLLWSAGNLIIPFFISRFGFFGFLLPETPARPIFSILGVVCGFLALIANVFLRPNVTRVEDQYRSVTQDDFDRVAVNMNDLDEPSAKASSPASQRLAGIAMAVAAGTLYGFTLVPFQIWTKAQPIEPGPFDFILSQYAGIYIASSLALLIYLIYCCAVGQSPQAFAQSMLPAIICGVGWAIASAGWMVATQNLGFSSGYPMVVIGPQIITAFWTVVVFKEIRGKRNLIVLAVSLSFTIVGVVFFVLSH